MKSDSIFKLSTNSDFAKALLERFLSPGHVLFSGKKKRKRLASGPGENDVELIPCKYILHFTKV